MTIFEASVTGIAIGVGMQWGAYTVHQVDGLLNLLAGWLFTKARPHHSVIMNGQEVCSKCLVPCSLAEEIRMTAYGIPTPTEKDDAP